MLKDSRCATSELSVVLQVKLHYVDLLHRAKYVRIAETIIGLLDGEADENDDEDELLLIMMRTNFCK